MRRAILCTVFALQGLSATGWAQSLNSLTLNPSTITAGQQSTGTVNLSGPAPTGGALIILTAGGTQYIQVPGSVSIPAGEISANFSVTTQLTPLGSLSTGISASYGGTIKSATVVVISLKLLRAWLNPSTLMGGESSTGTVHLNGPAPVGGVLVTLSTNKPQVVNVPGVVTIPAGATSATFIVNTYPVTSQVIADVNTFYEVGSSPKLYIFPCGPVRPKCEEKK